MSDKGEDEDLHDAHEHYREQLYELQVELVKLQRH